MISSEEVVAKFNRIARAVMAPRVQNRFLFWQVKGDFFAFGHTPHRQSDGKFYAMKYRSNILVKKVVFGKRHKAKEKAYHWYCQRRNVLEKLAAKRTAAKPVKPVPTKADIIQKQIEKCEAYIRRHSTRMKLLKTLIKKWERKKKYYQKKLKDLKP
jgi:hypothetical protein